MPLKSARLLCSHKFWVINEAIAVAVIHLENGVDHGLKLSIGEQFGGTMWSWLLLSLLRQVLAFLNVPVDEGLDELKAIQLVVVIVVVQLEVMELQLLLAHLAHVLVGAQHLTQVLLDVRPVLDMSLLTNEAATRSHLGCPNHLLLWNHALLWDHALLWNHPLLLNHPLLCDSHALLLGHELLRHLLLLVDALLWHVLLLLGHLHLRHLHLGDVLWCMHLLVLLHLATATQHQDNHDSPTLWHPL